MDLTPTHQGAPAVRELVRPVPLLPADARCPEVHEALQSAPEVPGVLLADVDGVRHYLDRGRFLRVVSGAFGWSLGQRRPVAEMLGPPTHLSLTDAVDLAGVAALLLARPASDRYDSALMVDDDGAPLGGVVVADVLACLAEEHARQAQAEEEFARQRRLVADMVDSAPLVLFELDAVGRFLLSEGRGLADLGLRPGQLVGADVFDVYGHDTPIADDVRRALAGDAFTSRAAVDRRTFSTSYRPRWRDGRVDGVVGVALDVSREQQAEQQLELRQQLATTLAEATSPGDAVRRALQAVSACPGWTAATAWTVGDDGPVALLHVGAQEPAASADVRSVLDGADGRVQGERVVLPVVAEEVVVLALDLVLDSPGRLPQAKDLARLLALHLGRLHALRHAEMVRQAAIAANSGVGSEEVLSSVLEVLVPLAGLQGARAWLRHGALLVQVHQAGELPGSDPVELLSRVEAGTLCLGARGRVSLLVVPVLAGSEVVGMLELLPRGSNGGLPSLVASVEQVGTHLGRAVERERATAAAEHLLRHDPLTGLGNRRLLQELGQQLPERAAVLLLDLDRFKEVNDALGHAQGDALLRQVATALQAQIGEDGTVLRLSGDQFVVLLHHRPATEAELLDRCRALLRSLAGPFVLDGLALTAEGSLGVALLPEHGCDLETLLARSDAAMYQAKDSGTGVSVWQPGREQVAAADLALLGELRLGIPRGELRLHYQPTVGPADSRPHLEALVRWQHPEHGLLPPGRFLALTEATHVIHDLTLWTLDEALAQIARWGADGRPVDVAVNLSARVLVREDLVDRVSDALSRHGVPAEQLTLEITESALVSQPDLAALRVGALRALGVRMSLDDFGTGYTSLALLTTLRFDELKVDRSFVSSALTNASHLAVVESILDLGHRLGLTVVAEGVEDQATAALLDRLGYDRQQGYLHARPGPAEALFPGALPLQRAGSVRLEPTTGR